MNDTIDTTCRWYNAACETRMKATEFARLQQMMNTDIIPSTGLFSDDGMPRLRRTRSRARP